MHTGSGAGELRHRFKYILLYYGGVTPGTPSGLTCLPPPRRKELVLGVYWGGGGNPQLHGLGANFRHTAVDPRGCLSLLKRGGLKRGGGRARHTARALHTQGKPLAQAAVSQTTGEQKSASKIKRFEQQPCHWRTKVRQQSGQAQTKVRQPANKGEDRRPLVSGLNSWRQHRPSGSPLDMSSARTWRSCSPLVAPSGSG